MNEQVGRELAASFEARLGHALSSEVAALKLHSDESLLEVDIDHSRPRQHQRRSPLQPLRLAHLCPNETAPAEEIYGGLSHKHCHSQIGLK